MEAFSVLLALCAGNSLVTGEFPLQRPVPQSFDVFFDLRVNERLSKQSWAGDSKRNRAHYDVIVMTELECYHEPPSSESVSFVRCAFLYICVELFRW